MNSALQILQKVCNAIFANTAQIQFETAVGDDGIVKYFLTQVVSHEGERLGIKPISTRQLVEVWINQKLSYEQQSLRQQVQMLFGQGYSMFSQMARLPDIISMNEQDIERFYDGVLGQQKQGVQCVLQAIMVARQAIVAKQLIQYKLFSRVQQADGDTRSPTLFEVVQILITYEQQLKLFLVDKFVRATGQFSAARKQLIQNECNIQAMLEYLTRFVPKGVGS